MCSECHGMYNCPICSPTKETRWTYYDYDLHKCDELDNWYKRVDDCGNIEHNDNFEDDED